MEVIFRRMTILLCFSLLISGCNDDAKNQPIEDGSGKDPHAGVELKPSDIVSNPKVKAKWIKQMGTTDLDRPHTASVNTNGDIMIAGYTKGIFDGENLNRRTTDAMLIKVSSDGQTLWQTQQGGSELSEILAMTDLVDGDVIVAGRASHQIGEQLVNGANDAFLRRVNSEGEIQWTSLFGNVYYEAGLTLFQDASNNISMISSCIAPQDGGNTVNHQDCPLNTLSQWDSSGNLIWSTAVDFSCGEEECSIKTDNEDNIIMLGTSLNRNNPVITKASQQGSIIWQKNWGSEADESGYSLTIDPQNNIYAAGFTKGALTSAAKSGFMDAFITKLSPQGKILWTQQWGSNKSQQIRSITFGKDGKLYATGRKTTRFDTENNTYRENLFVTCLDTEGNILWENSWESQHESMGNTIIQADDNTLYVVGYTVGDFMGHQSVGDWDIVILKLDVSGA